MGSISFLLPPSLSVAARAHLEAAVFTVGEEQVPVPTECRIQDGRLVACWAQSESRYLSVPWPVGPFGCLVTTTATLREQDQPYRLAVELARGKLHQVRSQAADWQAIGLRLPAAWDRDLAETTRQFARAALTPAPEGDELAVRVLEQGFVLADRLVRHYVEQLLEVRRSSGDPLGTRLAARTFSGPMPQADNYARGLTAARVALHWRDVEPEESCYRWETTDRAVAAALRSGLPITIGPVIDPSPGLLPPWVAAWEGDLTTLAAYMCDFLETALNRYRGEVRSWVVCSGFNHAPVLGLDDDDRFHLVYRLFESAQQLDPELDLTVGLAQPWGDYLADEELTIPPLTFADDLIRTGVKVSAVELEVRPGCVPRGSRPRDLLDTARLLRLFGLLGTPLELLLGYPASSGADEAAAGGGQSLWEPAWRSAPTPEGQAEWGASFVALGLAHPQVRAVTWDHWSDADPHLVPHAGLIDPTGRPRPLLARLQSLRAAYLT